MDPIAHQPTEDFDYFYDSIHGKVNFSDLPGPLHGPLRAILNSAALTRLTRISQLGYTSINFFSATQTRFSHAVGTLLMMHRLTTHLWGKGGERFPPEGIEEIREKVDKLALNAGGSPSESLISHLLMAALLQDIGELPFQKITSLYLRPHRSIFSDLEGDPRVKDLLPFFWASRKSVFTARGLLEIFQMEPLRNFSLAFLLKVIVKGIPAENTWLQTLRQMLDGVVDADRLDYVHRDAHLTIGSLSDPDSVVRTIVRYDEKGVVVNDCRPVIDFLATRARLWTFVYTAPAVRFRQALLRNILQGFIKDPKGCALLAENGIAEELDWGQFLKLDDHSVLLAFRGMTSPGTTVPSYAREALKVFTSTISDYECRVIPRVSRSGTKASSPSGEHVAIPEKAFFDLLYDHDDEREMKLYRRGSVRVKQALMEHCDPPVELERCAGAFSPLFGTEQKVRLIPKSFFVFLPDRNRKRAVGEFDTIADLMKTDPETLYAALGNEDCERDLRVPHNTWSASPFTGRRVAISCCFKDRVEVHRIVRTLHEKKQRYNVLLDSLLWIGGTPKENSRKLIKDAEAVLYVFSGDYVQSWKSREGNIYTEILEGREKENPKTKAIISLIPYGRIQAEKLNWSEFRKDLTEPPIINEGIYLYDNSGLDELVSAAVDWFNS